MCLFKKKSKQEFLHPCLNDLVVILSNCIYIIHLALIKEMTRMHLVCATLCLLDLSRKNKLSTGREIKFHIQSDEAD